MNHASSNLLRRAWLGVFLLATSTVVHADSWRPPGKTITTSAAGTARVTVTPRALSSSLAYFQDAGDGKEKPGQAPGADHASARVERTGTGGEWTTVWEGPLLNEVGPVDVLVSDDGSRLVTFDNWHAVGYGKDVVVVYDAKGQVVRQWSLEQLLPVGYVQTLPHSVSSIWWRGEDSAIVDGGATLRIDVAPPGADMDDDPRTVPLLLDLADGALRRQQRPEWAQAVATLGPLANRRQQAWDRYRASRATVLFGPKSREGKAWHGFLANARDRIDAVSQLLPAIEPGTVPRYDNSRPMVGMLDAYADEPDEDLNRFLFASPDAERLTALLEQYFAKAKPGSFAGATIWNTASAAQAERVRKAAAASGARIERIDLVAGMPGATLPAQPPPWFQTGMED